jgi:hypothetical protein
MIPLQEIGKYLTTVKDDLRELNDVFQFLQTVQRSNSPAPVAEMFAILRQEKPVIYGYLKQRVQSTPSLKLMVDLKIDYELAKKRLGIT